MNNEKKNKIRQRIKLFNIVRDIPFYISIGEEQDYSCATKSYILEMLFKPLGLKVKHILCLFKWEKFNLPKELLRIPHDTEETHEYLSVFIPENKKWVIVDPTWDSRIQHPSIPIAEWDGLNKTVVGVPAEYTWSPEESGRLIEQKKNILDKEKKEYLRRNSQFFSLFNRWLESNRNSL